MCLWATSTGAVLHRIEAHADDGAGWVMSLLLERAPDELATDSLLIATGSYDQTATLWTCAADAAGAPRSRSGGARGGGGWRKEHTLAHGAGVLALALGRSRRVLYSAAEDHSIRCWAVATGACVCVLERYCCPVHALGWHHASGCLAAGAEDGTVTLWAVGPIEAAHADGILPGEGAEGDGARLARRVHSVVVRGQDDEIAEVLCMAPSADGTALLCGLDDGSLVLLGHGPSVSR